MYKNLIAAFLTLAIAGCSCSDDAATPAADKKGETKAPQQQAPAIPAEEAKPPTEAELRIERIKKALADQGLEPQDNETLPTKLGNLDACKPTERRRYNLAGELVYVIVGTYPTTEAANACITAYEGFVGAMWDRFKGDFYRDDRFVMELNPTMTAEQKEKASAAVRASL